MKLILGSSVLALAWAAVAFPTQGPSDCPAVSGNITILSFQLYPENADFDSKRCLTYFSVLFNSTVAAWNPQTDTVEKILSIPGISGNPLLHSSGVKVDPLGRLSIIVDAGSAFDTGGANITGDNFLVLWQANLTAVTNGVYGGFQDVAHDAHGTSFALGTFPSSLIRVTADGQASSWYRKTPPDHTVQGFTGIVPSPDGKSLLVTDNSDSKLYRFDIASEQGVPVAVPITGIADRLTNSLDGVSIPSRWGGKVILVTDNRLGTQVLYSSDATWATAEFRGTVPNGLLAGGGTTVTTVQVSSSVYSVTEYFGDQKLPGSKAGSRSQWPLIDITANFEALVSA